MLNAKNHEKEAETIANAGKLNSVIITTSISGRGVDIQLSGKEISNSNNENDKINEEKLKVKSLGGLYVIGTGENGSRRVDNQAKEDLEDKEMKAIPFFVSLEDDLMRIFGSESINNMLEKLGLKDGESIEHPWINKALEKLNKKLRQEILILEKHY